MTSPLLLALLVGAAATAAVQATRLPEALLLQSAGAATAAVGRRDDRHNVVIDVFVMSKCPDARRYAGRDGFHSQVEPPQTQGHVHIQMREGAPLIADWGTTCC